MSSPHSPNATDPVTVTFSLTREEFLRAHRMVVSHQPVALVLPVAALALIVVGIVASGEWVIFGCALLVGTAWLWWGAARIRWRRDAAQAGPFTYTFDDAGVAITSPAGDVRLPWARVRKVITGKQLVVLLVGSSGVMFPRRVVQTGDSDRLERLLEEPR